MEKVRRDTNFIVLGLVLYTLLRYVIFALEPLARVCFVRLVCSDSAERTVLLQQLEENAANSGISSIVAVLAGVLFLGWYFRRDTPPRVVVSKKSSRFRGKRAAAADLYFHGCPADLLAVREHAGISAPAVRLHRYRTAECRSLLKSTTVSMFLYTAVFAPGGEELIYRGLVMRQFQKYGTCCHCGFRSVVRRDACQFVSDDICISHRTGAGIQRQSSLSDGRCAASGQ